MLQNRIYRDCTGAETVSAVDKINLSAKLGKIERIIQSGITPANDADILSAEKGTVAGSAIGNTAAGKLFLTGAAQFAVFGPVRDDDCIRCDGFSGNRQRFFSSRKCIFRRLTAQKLSPERLRPPRFKVSTKSKPEICSMPG